MPKRMSLNNKFSHRIFLPLLFGINFPQKCESESFPTLRVAEISAFKYTWLSITTVFANDVIWQERLLARDYGKAACHFKICDISAVWCRVLAKCECFVFIYALPL